MLSSVERTCRVVTRNGSARPRNQVTQSINDFRMLDAYVLLGPPGIGKTTTFRSESQAENCLYVSARDFVTLRDFSNWRGKTLFIDGLDEVRSGASDKRVSFDTIRANLIRLDKPRFRLSCREADWFGLNDERHLRAAAKSNQVDVLRLQELTLSDVQALLSNSLGIIDTARFIREAKKVGIEELLFNPQNLQMLAAAVNSGRGWPRSRFESIKTACEILGQELNQEHRLFDESIAIEELLKSAGHLCAILLLSGNVGYVQQYSQAKDVIQASEFFEGNSNAYRRVLASRLFKKTEVNTFLPSHGQVADFLAGKYLAQLIENGLSIERVFSLMTYADGAIVSQLRGMSAWLATWSASNRRKIISRDPIGTMLYGDVRNFSLQSKKEILVRFLEHLPQDRRILQSISNDSHLGDLATPDTLRLFEKVLSNLSPDDREKQYFALCLISALEHGSVDQDLCEELWRIIRNPDWHEAIRVRALELLLAKTAGDSEFIGEFEKFLEEVQDRRVKDSNDELRGSLLNRLLGVSMSLSQTMDYLEEPKNQGAYQQFWLSIDFDDVPIEEIEQSLDRIVDRLDQYRRPHERLALTAEFHGKVFFRILANFVGRASPTDTDKLILWLDAARELNNPGSDSTSKLKSTLIGRPSIIKAIVLRFVEKQLGFQDFDKRMDRLDLLLLNSRYQAVLGTWFLDQALLSTSEVAASWFVERMAGVVHSSLESQQFLKSSVEKRLQIRPQLWMAFGERIAELEDNERSSTQHRNEHLKSRRLRQEEWRIYIEEAEDVIRQNRLPIGILHQIAQVYFGEVVDVEGNTPNERLQNLLGYNPGVVNLAMQALWNSIFRDDVPDQGTIFELRQERKSHLLSLPILAGLQEASNMEEIEKLLGYEQRTRSALAIYFTVRLPQRADYPRWVEYAAKENAETFADVLVEAVRLKLDDGEDCREIAQELFEHTEFGENSNLSIFPLLKTFPVRCQNNQLPYLANLLCAASKYCDSDKLRDVIGLKLSNRGMNIGQRVYWLGMGLLMDPDEYYERFHGYIDTSDQRLVHVVRFLAEQVSSTKWIDDMDLRTVQLLIQLIGSKYRPVDLDFEVDFASGSVQASRCVSSLIDALSQDSSDDAVRRLNDFMNCYELSPWHERLKDASIRQKTVQREREFEYEDVKSVIGVLNNDKPANIVDLKAIALEAIDCVRRNLQDGNTSGWRKYWNVDSYNRVVQPKPENACRDIFADDFRPLMNRVGADVQPELQFADDSRCDLTVIFGDFKLPLEVKLCHSRDLWSAIEDQLVPRYTLDPASNGHGIYIVFWFGDNNEKCRPTSNNGIQPGNAEDLENQLMGTLPIDQRQEIGVCVVDVSNGKGMDA